MRIFLTGATGYIGSAVMDALLRSGHEVTALVRDPEKAERVSGRGVHPIIGELVEAGVVRGRCRRRRCNRSRGARRLEAHAEGRSAGDRHAARGRGTSRRRWRHPRAWSTPPVPGCSERRRTRRKTTPVNPIPLVAWRPDHERLVLDAGNAGVRTVVIRPGVVYGGARGIVGDLLKDAANGLVRVVGTGKNHWACIYDRDLADLYVRVVDHGRRGRHLPRQRRGRRIGGRHRRRRSPITRRCLPMCGTCRSTRRARRWVRMRTRSRSIRSCAVRVRARSAGRRRCVRWPAASRGCWKNSERPARPPRTIRTTQPSTTASISPYSTAFCASR